MDFKEVKQMIEVSVVKEVNITQALGNGAFLGATVRNGELTSCSRLAACVIGGYPDKCIEFIQSIQKAKPDTK